VAGLAEHAEPVPGRHGELAAQIADWATTATRVQEQFEVLELRPGVPWGPPPGDARTSGPVALALTSCFCLSAALGGLALIDDHRLSGGSDDDVQPIFEIAVQALWASAEFAAGVARSLDWLAEHGVGPPTESPAVPDAQALASAARVRESVQLQLTDLDQFQPADADAARPMYVEVLARVDDDLETIRAGLSPAP